MKCILYITLWCLWYLLYQEELRLHLYLRGKSTIQNMTKMLQKNLYTLGLEQHTYQYAESFCQYNFAQAGTWKKNLTLNFKLNLPATNLCIVQSIIHSDERDEVFCQLCMNDRMSSVLLGSDLCLVHLCSAFQSVNNFGNRFYRKKEEARLCSSLLDRICYQSC